MAIPFYCLYWPGMLSEKGLSMKNLISFVNLFLARVKASLAHVTVIVSAFFGAITRYAAATVAAIGAIVVPEMTRKGYGKERAVAVAAAAGCLGVLIGLGFLLLFMS